MPLPPINIDSAIFSTAAVNNPSELPGHPGGAAKPARSPAAGSAEGRVGWASRRHGRGTGRFAQRDLLARAPRRGCIWNGLRPRPCHTSRNGIGRRAITESKRRSGAGFWGDIPDTAPHAGLAGTPRPRVILHTLWGKKMSVPRITAPAPCLASGPAALFIPSWDDGVISRAF